jgi:hypothetical protein
MKKILLVIMITKKFFPLFYNLRMGGVGGSQFYSEEGWWGRRRGRN